MTCVSIPERLEQIFARHAHDIALSCNGQTISYAQLQECSAVVAAHLLGLGLAPGTTLAFDVQRSIEQVVLIVGMVRAGLSYCYLDPGNPAQWNAAIVSRSGIDWTVSEVPSANLLLADLLAPAPLPSHWPALSGEEAVYVNFSSGTTGAPKIIPCTHQGVLGFCDRPQHFALTPGFGMLYASNLTFDASQFEIWTSLLNGGQLCIHPPGPLTFSALQRYVRAGQVDSLWLTSTLFNTFIDIDAQCLQGVKRLMVGGETLSPAHIRQAYDATWEMTIYNGYGPTENTMGTCVYAIPRTFDDHRDIPIGHAVADAILLVVRDDGSACAEDEPGELLIAGAGLSPGYLGDAAQTRDKFIELDWQGTRLRCYRSGDLVSCDSDGLYRFHGRRDDQIKLRGQRISLSEITAAFKQYPGMLDCAVVLDDPGGVEHLVLVYLRRSAISPADLADYGRTHLPPFMVPQRFVAIERFPLRVSGKLDTHALQQHVRGTSDRAGDSGSDFLASFGLHSRNLAASFFDNGGNSLAAIKLIGRVNQQLGWEWLSLAQFYQLATLGELLAVLDSQPGLGAWRQASVERYYVIALEQEAINV
ncbi:hypothetical protein EXN22_14360 [Pseudomonas tructae]|uniref:Carrier domain-containing protein n=1 Tax=Pseudomonas tructae TaxID=2518644 RepID=A0A411MJ57_9PSED|nr:non-ribosomal peptide synthetase [Pseudomonas tructae]QBF26817.1 hypothetical protein EXN22_14360 [Pseudomonas tructae]